MDGDRDRDPHQSNGLCFQGPVERQKEGEDKQGSQDHEGFVPQLRQCSYSKGNSPNPVGLKKHVIKPDFLIVANIGN